MVVGDDVMLAEHEPSPPPEKVDITLVFYDGTEIAAPPKEIGENVESCDLHEMEKEARENGGNPIDEISGEIQYAFWDHDASTVGVKAYGKCVGKVKIGAERAVVDGLEDPVVRPIRIGIKKIAQISWKGMFDTYSGIEIILEKLEKEKPPPPHCPKCGAEMPGPAAEAPERVKFCPMCGRELRGSWWV
jgi:ribosomal protein S27AE